MPIAPTRQSRPLVGESTAPVDGRELFIRWQQHGDAAAREELVRRHLPLARKLARRYLGAREPVDDLIQVASVGLVNAIDRFDPERGIAFTSFAVPTILGELKRYFRDVGWSVRVPRSAQEAALKVEQAVTTLSARSGSSPDVTELAEYLEWDVDDVLDALEAGAAHHAASLDAPTADDDESLTLGESLGEADPQLSSADTRLSVAAATRELTPRQRRVLALRFAEDRTQAQIAELIGVSQMQVSRILRGALAQLSDQMEPTEASGGARLRRSRW
jgi:RNA polymerase sigma-B factor